MQLPDRITVDKEVRSGRPIILGTRVPVDLILGKLAGGMSYEEVIAEYAITREDVLASLDYAAQLVSDERLHMAV